MDNLRKNDNENLTTDACPSPPRDDPEKPLEFQEEIKEKSTPLPNFKKKSKPKTKKQPTHATANVININNGTGIQIGSNITINVGNQKSESAYKTNVIKTEAISNLLERTDLVTKQIISFVSDHLGKNWKFVGRELGYSEGQMDQFYDNNHCRGLREVIYQLLLDWIQNKPKEAKVGVLFSTLWNVSEREVVEKMVNKLKTQ